MVTTSLKHIGAGTMLTQIVHYCRKSNEKPSNKKKIGRLKKKLKKRKKIKNKQCLQILFIFNFFVTGIRIIQVPFSGAFTYFLDCTRYFRAIKPRQKTAVAFLAKRVRAYAAEGKGKAFLSLCGVRRRFDYSDSYWPLLRDVEIKPG